MSKVIITRGLPASGKSTWAEGEVAFSDGRIKRVNRDGLRDMVDNSQWSRKNEKFIIHLRNDIIDRAIWSGYDIIVDDTNLSKKVIKGIERLVRDCEISYNRTAEVVIKDFTDISLEECIRRDKNRDKSVGEKVITDMYNRYLK